LPSLFCAASPTAYISPLSLHDALPIWINERFAMGITENDALFFGQVDGAVVADENVQIQAGANDFERFKVGLDGVWQSKLLERQDRKSTRLNSSHVKISYAVFCLKKKK